MTEYVIVGAGSAGCVLARRLLERGAGSVLLLESGGRDDRAAIHDTDLGSMLPLWSDPSVTWQHVTVPQPGLGGRSVPVPQGRVLGGGSSVNAMMYVRGNRRDFDRWARQGCAGWTYDEVLPYFRRAEDFIDGASQYRGVDGPLSVVHYERPSAAGEAFAAAAHELGFTAAGGFDYNGERQDGAPFFYQSTRTKDNRRSSTAEAYLRPVAGDPRLTVATGTHATRVLMERGAAVGVEYRQGDVVERVRAERGVIVAAGAFGSPHLLLLSGIGPADEIVDHGIEPVVDLRGVGRNLHDHLLFGLAYASRVPLTEPALLSEAGLFTHTGLGQPDTDPPDLQFFFGPVQFVDDRYKDPGPGFTFAPILAQPRSRGSVTLRSADPTALPLVDPHYLQHEVDAEVLLRGLALSREMAHTNAFAGIRGRELAPGEKVTSRWALLEYIRASAGTVWHPVGTCRMGTDPQSVVDPQLRVHGVERLHVVDASVMPTITAGNTNAATIMIAEKAADLIAS